MNNEQMEKLVSLYEATFPQIGIREYATDVCGYKCCESWSREDLVWEFGYGYCIYMNEKYGVKNNAKKTRNACAN
jgi:hypothetical protein